VLGACAVIQVAFILTSPAASSSSAAPFRLLEFLSVIGSRLVVWSFFGADAVAPLSHVVRAALTVAFLVGLTLWALRSHPRRPQHVLALLTFFLVCAACFYRTRHDAWDHDNLENGDRYFYIPRVLLFWLVAWGCDAPRRWVAWTTTALVLVGFAVHLPAYFYPAPPDYHWADHCDPIRRGVPAKIPTLPEGWIMKYCGRL
jgi:amino acid transporter